MDFLECTSDFMEAICQTAARPTLCWLGHKSGRTTAKVSAKGKTGIAAKVRIGISARPHAPTRPAHPGGKTFEAMPGKLVHAPGYFGVPDTVAKTAPDLAEVYAIAMRRHENSPEYLKALLTLDPDGVALTTA